MGRKGEYKSGFWGEIMSDSEGYGKKVAENENWILWQNSTTRWFQSLLEEYDNKGFTLAGLYCVVYAQHKHDEALNTYLLMDNRTGRPYANWHAHDDFNLKKTLILMDLKDECDIVNMAKKKEER